MAEYVWLKQSMMKYMSAIPFRMDKRDTFECNPVKQYPDTIRIQNACECQLSRGKSVTTEVTFLVPLQIWGACQSVLPVQQHLQQKKNVDI